MTKEQFEKYYGNRKYKELRRQVEKIEYSEDEKDQMFKDVLHYINEKDYVVYHDLMDDICESHQDWFNMLSFDKTIRLCVLDLIKDRATSIKRYNRMKELLLNNK